MKKIVIGLGFGDEGKGLVVDWLCRNSAKPTVIRYSGGHQAGHCVRTDETKHIFSNFGSGTLAGVHTYWDAKTFDPVGFYNEYLILKSKTDNVIKIKVNDTCPITTPMDKLANQGRETHKKHGSVGVGFGTTLTREKANYHLLFKDIYYPEIFKKKYELLKQWYVENHSFYLRDIDTDKLAMMEEFFFNSVEEIKHIVSGAWFLPPEIYDRNDSDCFCVNDTNKRTYIYESSQGLMLDMDYGFFPYCTPSRVGTQELDVKYSDDIYLVTRAYSTRHGNGPAVTFDCNITAEDETNVFGEYQKNFRTGALDLDLINYSIQSDKTIQNHKSKYLVITCLDQINVYSFSSDGVLHVYKTEEKFLKNLVDNLPEFKDVYISRGPTAADIKLYKK